VGGVLVPNGGNAVNEQRPLTWYHPEHEDVQVGTLTERHGNNRRHPRRLDLGRAVLGDRFDRLLLDASHDPAAISDTHSWRILAFAHTDTGVMPAGARAGAAPLLSASALRTFGQAG
jgi:hypothetical protein